MNMKRMRGRNHRPNGGGGGGGGGVGGGGFRNQQNGIPLNRNHVFDSSGPEMRIRGTAQQLHEKYTQMARDASSSGDRVTGESYYQYAEHYFRIISAINQATGQNGQPSPNQGQPLQNGYQQSAPGPVNTPQNGQNDYQNRRPQHNQGNGGNFYQEPAEPSPESRSYETRQPTPNQTQYERRDERPRQEYRQEARQDARPDPVPERRIDTRIDTRIDISSALEAELAAAATVQSPAAARPAPTPAGSGAQPSLNIEPPAPMPEARAIPISTVPPASDEQADLPPASPAPAIRPRPRGRPRIIKPEAVQE